MPEVTESHTGRNLTMEAARVSAAGALGASEMMGRGDDQAADQAAVDAMHDALDTVMIDGTVQFGEGEEDQGSEKGFHWDRGSRRARHKATAK